MGFIFAQQSHLRSLELKPGTVEIFDGDHQRLIGNCLVALLSLYQIKLTLNLECLSLDKHSKVSSRLNNGKLIPQILEQYQYMRKTIFLMLLLFTMSMQVSAEHSDLQITPFNAEKSKKLKDLYGTSMFEAVGGTVSGYASVHKEIINFTIICLEEINSSCNKYALLSELNYNNPTIEKVYSLTMITSDLAKFSSEQVERFKNEKKRMVQDKYSFYYTYGSFAGVAISTNIGGKAGAISIPFVVGTGIVVDVVKSPFVAVAHGIEYLSKSVSSSVDAGNIFSFMTDNSKIGHLLHVNENTTYKKTPGQQALHIHIVSINSKSEFVKNRAGEDYIYEVHNKFFTESEYAEYIRSGNN